MVLQTTAFTLRPRGRKCVITWRSNGTNFIFGINGQRQSIATPISPAAMTRVHLAVFNGGLPAPIRYYEGLVYNSDLGAAAQTQIETYLTSNIGSADSTRTVAIFGDSLGLGTGSNFLITPFDPLYVSNRSSSLWYSFCGGGCLLQIPSIAASDLAALKGANEGVVIVWIGTNDILTNGQSGATTESRLNTYCTTLKNAGCKVIVTTLSAFVTNNTERVAYNTAMKANFASYANAIVRLDEQANLSDSTNTTFFEADGVHLTDAGYAIAGGLFRRQWRVYESSIS